MVYERSFPVAGSLKRMLMPMGSICGGSGTMVGAE